MLNVEPMNQAMTRTLFFFALILMTAAACGHNHEASAPAEVVVEARIATPDAFKSGLETQLEAYFALKDVLVATKADSAAIQAAALTASLEAWTVEGLSAEADSVWSANRSVVLEKAAAITGLTDVEAQRFEFESLSMAMIEVVEAFGPLSNTLYRQTCPMVRGGSADWLAKEEQIANPYHGSRMLRCGEVVRKI
jgi:Cu(I)/Ag(I) efflux system membrane fusion protein